MVGAIPFRRVAVIGTGLIGGSFALSLRKQFPGISIVGYDRPAVLDAARVRGSVDQAADDLAGAVRGADLVYIALPIAAMIESLPAIAAAAAPHALVTDAGSTKAVICRVAKEHFRAEARFLGGHPMAGKEHSGIDNADPDLFSRAPYVLIGQEREADARVISFLEVLRAMGAQPIWSDADTHDWAVGIVSHLPQLVSVALAGVVRDETDETGLPLTFAGPGLHDMLRLSGSSYEVWRDVFLTNPENAGRALDRLTQAIDHLRTHLASKELEQEFQAANEIHMLLRKRP